MSRLKSERYFAAGMVGAIFALYTASTFFYFSSNNISVTEIQQSNNGIQIATSSKPASTADDEQLMMIMDKTQAHGIYSPLNNGMSTVPGVNCRVTEQNLDFEYNFKNIPKDCVGILGGN